MWVPPNARSARNTISKIRAFRIASFSRCMASTSGSRLFSTSQSDGSKCATCAEWHHAVHHSRVADSQRLGLGSSGISFTGVPSGAPRTESVVGWELSGAPHAGHARPSASRREPQLTHCLRRTPVKGSGLRRLRLGLGGGPIPAMRNPSLSHLTEPVFAAPRARARARRGRVCAGQRAKAFYQTCIASGGRYPHALSAPPGSGGTPLGHFPVTPKRMLFCIASAAQTPSRCCCSTFTRAFLCVMVAAQSLQVVQRVVVARENMVDIRRHFSAARACIDPDPIASISTTLKNDSTNASPVSRQSLAAVASTPHVYNPPKYGGRGSYVGGILSYGDPFLGGDPYTGMVFPYAAL